MLKTTSNIQKTNDHLPSGSHDYKDVYGKYLGNNGSTAMISYIRAATVFTELKLQPLTLKSQQSGHRV